MYNFTQKILIALMILTLASPHAFAIDLSSYSLLKDKNFRGLPGNEYVSGNQPGVVLMRINLWGAVQKAGVHFVPAKTDLVTLLSYAGGPTSKAILDEVVIKRQVKNQHKKITVDIDQLLNEASSHKVVLEPNDIIMIREDKPLISSDTTLLLTVVATVGSILLTGIIISDRSK